MNTIPPVTIHGVTHIQDIRHARDHNRLSASGQDFITHNNRLAALQTSRPVFRLVKSLQAHRGASTAILSGEQSYLQHQKDLEDKISRAIFALEHLCIDQHHRHISRNDIDKIQADWHTIVAGWHDDDVIENFEFHSHLIHHLSHIGWQLLKTEFIEHDYHLSQAKNISQPMSSNTRFIRFCLQQTPAAVEQLAKLRGLATHCTVIHECDESHQIRLQYLCRQTKKDYVNLLERYQDFNSSMALIAPSLPKIKDDEQQLNQLLSLISDKVLHNKTLTIRTESIYKPASKIINDLSQISEQAINALEQGIKQEIDAWYDS